MEGKEKKGNDMGRGGGQDLHALISLCGQWPWPKGHIIASNVGGNIIAKGKEFPSLSIFS